LHLLMLIHLRLYTLLKLMFIRIVKTQWPINSSFLYCDQFLNDKTHKKTGLKKSQISTLLKKIDIIHVSY
jgi:hypothetical protein